MKLILRNQLVQTTQGQIVSVRRPATRIFLSLTLAGVVSGVNWYFQNFIADQDNERQRQLIERVSND